MNHVYPAILLVMSSPALYADGLVFREPTEGQWIEFSTSYTVTQANGPEFTVDGTLKMTALNTTQIGTETYRWLEFAVQETQEGKTSSYVDKILVQNGDLGRDKDPLKNIGKLLRQRNIGSGPVQETTDFSGGNVRVLNMLPVILHGPSEKTEQLEPLVVDTKIGKMDCKGVKYSRATSEGGAKVNSAYVVRLHDDAPFGVVGLEVDRSIGRTGEKPSMMKLHIQCLEFGSGGKSLLPDRQ